MRRLILTLVQNNDFGAASKTSRRDFPGSALPAREARFPDVHSGTNVPQCAKKYCFWRLYFEYCAAGLEKCNFYNESGFLRFYLRVQYSTKFSQKSANFVAQNVIRRLD